MSKLLIATTNQGKLVEFQKMLDELKIEVLTLNDMEELKDIDVVEDGKTFKENAIKKAKEYGKKAEMLTIADDTGLIVDALDGKPGVHSKRYGATDKERNDRLLKEMEGKEERTARFAAVIALYDPADDRVYTSQGLVEGEITRKLKGEDGFGYDPVFYSIELKKTFAEATREEKNVVSHRGRALRLIQPMLIELLTS